MSKLSHPRTELLVAAGLVILISGSVQSQTWVNDNPTPRPTAAAIAAQRKEIEEIKVIFARIDARIVQIEKVHRRIEAILQNYEATTTCVALEQITKTRQELLDQLQAAPNAAEKTKVQKEIDLYERMFAKATQAASRFECRE